MILRETVYHLAGGFKFQNFGACGRQSELHKCALNVRRTKENATPGLDSERKQLLYQVDESLLEFWEVEGQSSCIVDMVVQNAFQEGRPWELEPRQTAL